jgi:hypothetical protein
MTLKENQLIRQPVWVTGIKLYAFIYSALAGFCQVLL